MKTVEVWERTINQAAPTFPAFARTVQMLQTDAGRQRVLLCIRDKQRLEGIPGKSDSTGIQECRVVKEELDRMKQGAPAAAAAAGGHTTAMATGAPPPRRRDPGEGGGGGRARRPPRARLR